MLELFALRFRRDITPADARALDAYIVNCQDPYSKGPWHRSAATRQLTGATDLT